MRTITVSFTLLTLVLASRIPASAEDPCRLEYAPAAGNAYEYEVRLYYDWSQTSSADAVGTAVRPREGRGAVAQMPEALQGTAAPSGTIADGPTSGGFAGVGPPSGGTDEAAGIPFGDPAEVNLRVTLAVVEADAPGIRRLRIRYGAIRVRFADDITSLEYDYAQPEHRRRATKRIADLADPRRAENFRKVRGQHDNPYFDQYWRILAYSRLDGFALEFGVAPNGGDLDLPDLFAAMSACVPAHTPQGARQLLSSDVREILDLLLPRLPDPGELALGRWSNPEGVPFRPDGVHQVSGAPCLRFRNAERHFVHRGPGGSSKLKTRLDECFSYSPRLDMVVAHERETTSSLSYHDAYSSVFGSGKRQASARLIRVTPTRQGD